MSCFSNRQCYRIKLSPLSTPDINPLYSKHSIGWKHEPCSTSNFTERPSMFCNLDFELASLRSDVPTCPAIIWLYVFPDEMLDVCSKSIEQGAVAALDV